MSTRSVSVHAQKFDRSDKMLRRSVRMARKQGASYGFLTETYERRHVLDRLRGIDHHSVGDCSIWWPADRFTPVRRGRVSLDHSYRTERGRLVPQIDMPLAALRDRHSGQLSINVGLHLPRGIESSSWKSDKEWVVAAKKSLRAIHFELEKLLPVYEDAYAIIGGDWNLDLNLQHNRQRIRSILGKEWGLGGVMAPTHGARRIDGLAVLGGSIKGSRVTDTPAISDHDLAVVKIKMIRGMLLCVKE